MVSNVIECDLLEDNFETTKAVSIAAPRKFEYLYYQILFFSYMFFAALYGLCILPSASWHTILFNIITMITTELGVTAGAHRLWAHKSYAAKMPLQFVLVLFQSMAMDGTAFDWAKEHRMHHKYTDTDGDPYNASRGLFFSHIGWLLVKKHPEVVKRGKIIDISDLKSNSVLMFQRKNSFVMRHLFGLLLPTIIPVYFWGESLRIAWHLNALRDVINLNMIFCINSLAHAYGYKPYDKNIKPAENLFVSAFSLGEGFHNYHHVFPGDYRTAEWNNNYLNVTTKFIDFCARMGWAYDLKTVTNDVIFARSERTGDGGLNNF